MIPPVLELALAKSPDTAIGQVLPVTSASARPSPVAMGLALPEVLIAPPWVVPIKHLSREPISAWWGDKGGAQ